METTTVPWKLSIHCAQSQPSFLSTHLTYHLKFALTTIISKSFFTRLKQSGIFTLDFMLILWCFTASIETFLKDLFYLLYMLQGLFVWEYMVLCFGRLLQGRRQDQGDAVTGIVGCLSSYFDSNSGPHDEAMFPSLHCFSSLLLSEISFSFFLFFFIIFHVLCLLCTVFFSFIFYLFLPFMYSRSLVSVWKKQAS